MPKKRTKKYKRVTKETNISLDLCLDGEGKYTIDTGIVFFDHMLTHIAKHGGFNLTLKASGDKIPDFHHLIEDVGIALGESFNEALADKKGINRYGFASCPMDESQVSVSLDFSGRPYLVYDLPLNKKKVGDIDEDTVEEFFKAFAGSAAATVHIHTVCGKNPHHLVESAFKSFGRALKEAVKHGTKGIPSTKGVL
ncbi:MAG: imidazoleglycerol-phosphate dehydratase [Candidatus Firestonebacteria bacterium RIFOXYA2_FULL_40_8]|nr:MAG: imidazoleglycerol-phosphate dehydratase [Candidatus Firestonebacteria bacterium RIFOXYA2_FULL_40_8]